ncbi:MAG TPA: MFS transporter [Planctomycetaceae bacterium]|nr:MFS transporter [Planctomycetaceae bacterium]HBC61196.1 MFS transporter [Planctomycetaceae bacterium]
MKLRLFIMMFLEFFIWGAWLPLIFGYLPALKFSADLPPALLAGLFSLPGLSSIQHLFSEQALILNAFPIASIIGMFFSNQFADRNFAAERFLAFSHLVGGLSILGLFWATSFWPFFLLMSVHCLLYVPTISITNSVAFANMRNPQEEFGVVRLGGTLGWICAAWPFTFILVDWAKVKAANPGDAIAWLGTVLGSGLTGDPLKDATRYTYLVAGIASLILAAFSLTLPHTPPKKPAADGSGGQAWLQTLSLLKQPFVLVLWLVAFIDSFVHNCYFNWTGTFLTTDAVGVPGNWVMPVMSIGQIAEILTMLVLGATLKALGWRTTMIVGILGHAFRFAVYAYAPNQALIILVQIVHGICYAFFFATVYIFVDEYFPKDLRSSAQGLFNVMILGVGALAANSLCPWLLQSVYTKDGVTDFKGLFLVPMICSIVASVALALLFHPPKKSAEASGPVVTGH